MAFEFLRDAAWLTRERVRGYATLLVIASAATTVWLLTGHGGDDPLGRPVGTDFVSFWTVSWALLHGQEKAIYTPAALAALELTARADASQTFYAWQYPPVALLIVYPLALLPYLWSLALWLAAGLAGYLWALWRILPEPLTLWAGLAFPAVLVTATHGQNALLTTALFGWGLLMLGPRPVVAGVALGLLIFKPQLCLLIPVALAAGRQWRALGAAALTGLVFAAAAAILCGVQIWADFISSAGFARAILEQGLVGYYKMQSVFAAARLLGGSLAVGYWLQGLAAALTTAVLAWTWRRSTDWGLRGAALLVATPLATPFVLDYDLTILAPAIAWLARKQAQDGAMPWERTAMAVAALAPLIARPMAAATHLLPTPLALAGLLAVIVVRINAESAAAPARAPSACARRRGAEGG